jgi:hypothetical protein
LQVGEDTLVTTARRGRPVSPTPYENLSVTVHPLDKEILDTARERLGLNRSEAVRAGIALLFDGAKGDPMTARADINRTSQQARAAMT